MAKSSPWNPFDWMRSMQDWFVRAEKSSGFRPYLIFLILVCCVGIILLKFFRDVPGVPTLAEWIIGVSVVSFVILFAIKSFQQPDFCRSETHIQRMKKIELETMGSEYDMIEGELVEKQIEDESIAEPPRIEDQTGRGRQ